MSKRTVPLQDTVGSMRDIAEDATLQDRLKVGNYATERGVLPFFGKKYDGDMRFRDADRNEIADGYNKTIGVVSEGDGTLAKAYSRLENARRSIFDGLAISKIYSATSVIAQPRFCRSPAILPI